MLLRADLGTEVAARIAAAVGEGRYDKAISADEVKAVVATEVENVLAPVAKPLAIDGAQKPFVILVIGVNGSGKTTTIGKLAAKFRAEGRKVMLAAGDTFRAAAIEQLKIWGERAGAPVIAREQGADAAGLAFDALDGGEGRGRRRAADRHRRPAAEQGRADERAGEDRPRASRRSMPRRRTRCCWCSTPPSARTRCRRSMHSCKTAGVTGLVMTKLDGTARGGILVALSRKVRPAGAFHRRRRGDRRSRAVHRARISPAAASRGTRANAKHSAARAITWLNKARAASAVQARDRAWPAGGLLRGERAVRSVRRHRRASWSAIVDLDRRLVCGGRGMCR